MAKKIMATLVDAKTYSIVTQDFIEGVPQEVTAQVRAQLEPIFRTFSDPENKEKTHKVSMFKFEEVDDTPAQAPAADGGADQRTR